ncbi:MAG TPA: hypothetical protein VI704_03065 [Bacteroidota bacterium]|nr:hypothetical protein [Bacteroidota bacterium]
MTNLSRLLLASVLSLFFAAAMFAQGTPLITKVNVGQALEKTALSVSVELSKSTGVTKIDLYYRTYGTNDYTTVEMLIAGRIATSTIPAEAVLPPYLEYYVNAHLESGGTETYPLQNPETNPQRVTVKAVDPKDLEVRILSPEPGETVDVDELVVAISFFYASDNVKREATKIFLDNTDVTKDAIVSDDVLLFSPKSAGRQVALGSHRLRIELYDTEGKLYHTMESSFGLSTAVAIAQEKARLQALVDGQAEYRNEDLRSIPSSTSYIRGDVRMNGSYGWLNFGATAHIDNQEDPSRQPQNRFLAYAATSYLSLQVGDAYPRFPSYIVSGKRVRGLSANLMLGFFNVDFTMGETERGIEGLRLYDTTYVDSSSAATRPSNSSQISGLKYTIFQSGTFQRDFFAVRPSFGNGEVFQLGFTYMHAKDQIGSVKFGSFPTENLVLGTDFLFALDNQRIKLESQASVSVTNTDISGGSFQDKDFDDLAKTDQKTADDLRNLSKVASTFITINKNLFPTNPLAGIVGGGEGAPGASYESILSLNYLNNYLRGSLFRRGAGYKSFGNEFLQADVKGFSVSDRIRMFTNRVFLSVAYEKREDNTANNKPGTTTFDYLNTSLTVVPGADLPTFTVGYGINNQASDNSFSRLTLATAPTISRTDSTALAASLSKAIDNASNQYYVAANYDFEAKVRHSLSLSINAVDRTDKTFYKRDQSNLNLQLSLSSTITTTFQTSVSYLLSKNQSKNEVFKTDGRDSLLQTTDLDYSSATVGAQMRFFDERMRVLASFSPTWGAFNRAIARVGVDYSIAPRHTLEFSFDYIQNSGSEDDRIGSLIYRFGF